MHGCHQETKRVGTECDSPEGDVAGIREVWQLMGRCNSMGEMKGGFGRCKVSHH